MVSNSFKVVFGKFFPLRIQYSVAMPGLYRQNLGSHAFFKESTDLTKKNKNGTCIITIHNVRFDIFMVVRWFQRVEVFSDGGFWKRRVGVVSNSFRPLRIGVPCFPSLGTGKKTTRWTKECVRVNADSDTRILWVFRFLPGAYVA